MASLEAAADWLMGKVSTIEGMKAAPEKPPEKIQVFPFALCYPAQGVLYSDTVVGEYRNIATLTLEVHVGRPDLGQAVDAVYPFIERVAAVLFNANNLTFGGNIDTVLASAENPINWSFGTLNWATVETIGWRFDIPIKYKNVIA